MAPSFGSVLVVDDSPLVQSLIEQALVPAYQVHPASSGEEALALARGSRFDAVLCDLSMPGMPGLEVLAQLKALHPLVPVIMFTESLQLTDAVEAMRLGAFGYVPKGVADQALVDELHKAIAHRKVLERNLQLEEAAATYLRERERSQVIEQQALRHAAELKGLVDHKTKQIAELESARAQESRLVAIGSLVAGIAHEVNNPLAVLRSGAQFLAESIGDTDPETVSEVRATLEEIDAGAQRIQAIVGNLRRLVQEPPAGCTCNPEGALAELWTRYRAALPAGVTARLELDPATTQVGLSQDDLVLVVSHLLSNASDAIKTRGETGEIAVRIRTVCGQVSLEVKDNGCGISAEHLSQVWNPFFTTKPPGAGTGLGLSLVHQVVKNALGSIRIDSVVGRGTRIEVTVPTEASRPARSPAARS